MAFWAAVAKSVIPIIVDGIVKHGSSGGTHGWYERANPSLFEQSNIETQGMKQQQEIINRLLGMADNYDRTPVGRLNIPDSPYLDEDMLGGLEPSWDIALLQSLLGQNPRSGATSQLASLGQRQSELDFERQSQLGESISGIIGSLFEARKNSSSGSDPSSNQSAVDVYNNYTGVDDAVQPFLGGNWWW